MNNGLGVPLFNNAYGSGYAGIGACFLEQKLTEK